MIIGQSLKKLPILYNIRLLKEACLQEKCFIRSSHFKFYPSVDETSTPTGNYFLIY